MDDIKDIRLPIETPVWVWILLGAGIAAVLFVVYYFFLRKQKVPAVPLAPVIVRTAWEIALERLDLLSAKKYPSQGVFKPFYFELSNIVRHYLEARFQIKAPEMTTEEFLVFVKTTAVLSMDQKGVLQEFLNSCDMVKFAKHEPNINDALAHFESARKLVLETKDGI